MRQTGERSRLKGGGARGTRALAMAALMCAGVSAALVSRLIPAAAAANTAACVFGLDPSFDNDGKVTTDLGLVELAKDVVVQADGKIVVAGHTARSDGTQGDFAVVRYNPDGTLDSTFGTAGKVTTDFNGGLDSARAVAVQSDGKLVAAGHAARDSSNQVTDIALARYNPNGTPDTSFGSGGRVSTTYDELLDKFPGKIILPIIEAIAVQPDGKIVIGGAGGELVLLRYHPNGSVDSSFGTGGAAATDGLNSYFGLDVFDLVLQPDGKIVAAGSKIDGTAQSDFAVARFNSNGSPDSTFGTAGISVTDINFIDVADSAALQADGKILVAGYSNQTNGGQPDHTIVRYNANGSLDPSFGSGGVVSTRQGEFGSAVDIALLADGRIVIVGPSSSTGSESNFALAIYNANGSLDASTVAGGKIETDFGAHDLPRSVVVQPDGRIVLTGTSGDDIALARYSCSATPTPATVQFSAATFNVTEGCVPATLTVTLTGTPSGTVAVDYTVNEGTARQKTDFTYAAGTLLPAAGSSPMAFAGAASPPAVSGTLVFAAGETEKEITILITEDGYAEGTENLSATLSNPRGAGLGGTTTATLNIDDNDASDSQTNPIDDPPTYVCQLYHDFLHRQPDPAGQAFWAAEITNCGADAACLSERRHNVAAAFFLSIEFQQTGFFVYRAYEAGLDRRPRYEEFMRDLNAVGLGVEVLVGNWQQRLASQRQAFVETLVERPEFKALFPEGMTAEAFADKLFLQAGSTPTSTERQSVVAAYGVGNTQGRAAALAAALDTGSVFNRLYNPGFVLVEYFGFLRRDPDDPPDSDLSGYDFWLAKMDSFTLAGEDARLERDAFERIKRAEMVRAFIVADEYRKRFGP